MPKHCQFNLRVHILGQNTILMRNIYKQGWLRIHMFILLKLSLVFTVMIYYFQIGLSIKIGSHSEGFPLFVGLELGFLGSCIGTDWLGSVLVVPYIGSLGVPLDAMLGVCRLFWMLLWLNGQELSLAQTVHFLYCFLQILKMSM